LQSKEWGDISILRVLPVKGNIWGDLDPIKDTPWGKLIPVVSGLALSHALHGYVTPLMREIGPHPHGLLKQIPEAYQRCTLWNNCLMYRKKTCIPCTKLPECYNPPGFDPEDQGIISEIAIAWRDGQYVIVVQGEEFA